MKEPLKESLDPQAAAALERFERRGLPPWHSLSVEAARRLEDDLFGGDASTPVDRVTDLAIPGPDGEIPIRLYRHDADGRPTLVYYHGGGWVLGTLDGVDDICRTIADRTGAVVVSVDYRLAPEHPFPEPLEDAVAALEWASEYADSIGGDPDRLGVAGTSAGGNLAAATALAARTFDGPELDQQVLLYPMTDYEAAPPPEDDCPVLTGADVRWFWDQYLRHPVDGANPYASVSRTPDIMDLPSATVLTCGHDPLRDEGVAYADALAESGVDVRHDHFPSLPHGALSLADEVDTATEALEGVVESIREHFDRD